jgi:Zn-dependent protease with chaperone function
MSAEFVQPLVHPSEKRLFRVLLVLAAIFWIVLIVATKGLGLAAFGVGSLLGLFTHSALIAYLKGNAVEITEAQFPDLHARLLRACTRIGMRPPRSYILNGNGVLNAFATRFLNSYYMVLMSDVVDAFEGAEDSGAIDFYIGHELGHIHRRHLTWLPVLLPTAILPLLMPAYRRAQEMTCDRYGRACCDSSEDAVKGLTLLAAGGKRWKTISVAQYVDQARASGGFWMSLHELTAGYPWLSKRVALVRDPRAAFPRRSVGAWVLGAFCPGFLNAALLPLLFAYVAIMMTMATLAVIGKKHAQAGVGASAADTPGFEAGLMAAMAAGAAGASSEAQAQASEPPPAPGPTQWKHPITSKWLALPAGMYVYEGGVAEGLNTVVSAFTSDLSTHVERLGVEDVPTRITLDLYLQKLARGQIGLTVGQPKSTHPAEIRFETIDGARVGTYVYLETPTEKTIIRVWRHRAGRTWQLASTWVKASPTATDRSDALFRFLLQATR